VVEGPGLPAEVPDGRTMCVGSLGGYLSSQARKLLDPQRSLISLSSWQEAQSALVSTDLCYFVLGFN